MPKTAVVIVLLLFMISCANLAEDQPLNKYNNDIILMANTGFYDPKTYSLVNLYNTSEFVHGSPAFCVCGFYNKIKYTPRKDRFTDAQIQITLNKLEPKNIVVNVHFAQMSACGGNDGFFLSTIDNDAGVVDTIQTKVNGNTKVLTLTTTHPSPSGIYYINSMGVNTSSDCNFAVNRVTVDYVPEAKK